MDFYWLSILLHSEHVVFSGSPGGGEDGAEGVSGGGGLTGGRRNGKHPGKTPSETPMGFPKKHATLALLGAFHGINVSQDREG